MLLHFYAFQNCTAVCPTRCFRMQGVQTPDPPLSRVYIVFVKCMSFRYHGSVVTQRKQSRTQTESISASPASISPCFLLFGVALPLSPLSSPSVHSVTSHSTWTPLSECPPRCCLNRPRLVLRTISSNHGAPRALGSDLATVRVEFVSTGPATLVSSSLLSPKNPRVSSSS